MVAQDFPWAGRIAALAPQGLGAALGLQPGDELLAINDQPLRDVIDVQFYGAEEYLDLLIRRDDDLFLYEAERAYDQPLGIIFEHPTFDASIYRCDNRCAFCFVHQMPPGLRPTLYVKDDDYRYSFLQGNFVTLTNTTPEEMSRIAEQHLSPLYVSVHATDLALRRHMLGNPQAPDIMTQLRWLAAHEITLYTQIVVAPGLNDGPHLDRSIRDLATLWPAVRAVNIVPVGITRYHRRGHRPNNLDEARDLLTQVQTHQEHSMARLGMRFAYPTDEWYLMLDRPVPSRAAYDGLALQENGLGMVRAFLEDWQKAKTRWKKEIEQEIPDGIHITLGTGTLFAPTLARVARELTYHSGNKLRITVLPLHNRHMGETITVAGLLTGADVIAQLQGRELGSSLILPRIMFDHPDGIALDGIGPEQITQALACPVLLAENMTDVIKAAKALLFSPV